MMWPDQRTAYAAFLVVACEALKPIGKRYDRMNVYDVVASLLSESDAHRLRQISLHPQKIRSDHLHRAQLSGGELLPLLIDDHFRDPSFDDMLRILVVATRTCLIEWLRREGQYQVIRLKRQKGYITSVFRHVIGRALRLWRLIR
jgi:hypothetical protein